MTTKTYTSNSCISINVVLSSKKNMRVSFSPLSNGSSVYITNNAQVQNAIEKHCNFGKLFKLSSTKSAEDTPQAPEPQAPADSLESKLLTITVTDLGTAKDYLADKFGISRTKLRGIASITKEAAANGIVFEGLE